MKAFIIFSMALAIAASAAVDGTKKEKRDLWGDLGYLDHGSLDDSLLKISEPHSGLEWAEPSASFDLPLPEVHFTPKSIPVPYPVEVEKHIPVEVKVPYPVAVEKHVPVEVKVPYPVAVEKHVPVVVEKKVPVYVEKRVPVHVDRPVPYPVEVKVPVVHKQYVEVPKPYAVHVEKPVPVVVEKPVLVEAKPDKYKVTVTELKKPGPFAGLANIFG